FGQTSLEHAEIGRELVRRERTLSVPDLIALGRCQREIQPSQHAGQQLAKDLARVPRSDARSVAAGGQDPFQVPPELVRNSDSALADDQPANKIAQALPVPAQRGEPVLQQRTAGHLVGDEWIPVAISPDPRAELEKRRELEGVAGIVVGESPLEALVNLRDGLEQSLVEEVEGPRNLLLHRGLLQSKLAGHPEQLDLEAYLALQLGPLARCPPGRLELHQETIDPAVLFQDGDPLRLSGM